MGPWLPWMKMGNHLGSLVYSAWGSKVADIKDLPLLLKTEINGNLSLYQTAPLSQIEAMDMTSWIYFKTHFDAYLTGKVFPLSQIQ